MTCPFLRETRAFSCQSAAVRKLIPRMQPGTAEGRCRTEDYRACPSYGPPALGEEPPGPPCPLLRESLVQYCAASPLTRFIPSSEAMLSRCGNGAFRYCEFYLDLAQAAQSAGADPDAFTAPAGLLFTRNHMWIDLPEEGPWHIGIDAFLARLIGPADRLTYLTPKGWACPAAVLTLKQTELQLVFPEPLQIEACNLYLRAHPERIATAPYTHGWLFEGVIQPEQRARLVARLLDPAAALAEMDADARSLHAWVEARQAAHTDGGQFQPGLLRELPREDALRLFHQFGAPFPSKGDKH